MPNRFVFAVAVALLPGVAAAQSALPGPVVAAQPFDSGWIDNPSALPVVVASHTAHVADAAWLRLEFGACHLPEGSVLRLTGQADGAVQWFAMDSLRDYQFRSACFNGTAVRIDLIAAGRSRGNRLAVANVLYGAGCAADGGVCGPADTRTLSNDPRIGRLDGCCTMFLLGEFVLATAGHCLRGTGGIVSFNVPLSDPAGAPRYPPPSDQYAFLAGSMTSVDGGLGNDYGVIAAVRNSNTGLYPGQAQGSWLSWNAPPLAGGQTVVVTGYGAHALPAWSHAQKSGSGLRGGGSTAVLYFDVSVTGCNSGSPVVLASSGEAWGITTHAGCTATGGTNYGTGFGLPALAQAITNLAQSHVAGSATAFGQGCGGGAGAPMLGFLGVPDVGHSLSIEVANLNPATSAFGTLVIGFSDTQWAGGSLPAPLAPFGMPGCTLYASGDALVFLPTNFGANGYVQVLPNVPAFVGAVLFTQYLALDASAGNPARMVASNAGRIRVGN